jgi:uncharacterized integral membrane protein
MKKKFKPEQVRQMNRKFWIVVIVGCLILAILTIIDLHYMSLKYFEPR